MNVTTIGETNDFPAFYSRVSGFKVSDDLVPLNVRGGLLELSMARFVRFR